MALPLYEQETTISYSRDSDMCECWTNDRTMITKLDKLVIKYPQVYTCIDIGYSSIDNDTLCKKYRFSKKMLSFRTGTVKRTLTPEQKEKMRNRALLLHANNASNKNNISNI